MTTPPSTADSPGPSLDWLPDEKTLNRLAGEFFAALPGTAPTADPLPGAAEKISGSAAVPADPAATGVPAPGGPPGAPMVLDPVVPSEQAARQQVPAPAADPFQVSVPRLSGAPLPVTAPSAGGEPPVNSAPAFPAVPDSLPEPVSVPHSPYYFLAESSAFRRGGPGLSPGAGDYQVTVPDLDLLAAAPFAPEPAGLDVVDREPAIPAVPVDPHPAFDVLGVRRDFPILAERVNGRPLIWLDNAATTQKPRAVIDRLTHFYEHENSNIHRAAHELAARATDAYEGARSKVARFLNAGSADDIVFVRGATEGINLVAQAWGGRNLRAGDEIVISHLEHHANIVPWQMLAQRTGAVLRVIPVDDTGQILLDEYTKLLSGRTKIVAVAQVSNALGTVTPARQIVELGHRAGACVLIDGAQSVPHLRVDLASLGADFFVFSGHKIFGPTGIGVVYGRPEVLADMPAWQGGGNMIADVTLERSVFQGPPARFEAGTGNIADAVGLGAALDYVDRIGLENIALYEHQLLEYATAGMTAVPGLRMIGTAAEKASVLSFVLHGYRPEEIGAALNQDGIAVRSGHHCAQPILRRFGLEATVRPSLAFYNTCEEVDTLVAALHRLSSARARR